MPILIQMNTFSLQEEVTITSPDVLVKVLNKFFFLECKAEEYVYMLAVNTAMKPIGFFEISHGSVNATLVESIAGKNFAIIFTTDAAGNQNPI